MLTHAQSELRPAAFHHTQMATHMAAAGVKQLG